MFRRSFLQDNNNNNNNNNSDNNNNSNNNNNKTKRYRKSYKKIWEIVTLTDRCIIK